MKQKEKYEAPRTACTEVELESGLLKASVVDKDKDPVVNDPVDAGDQVIGGDYDFTGNSWDFGDE